MAFVASDFQAGAVASWSAAQVTVALPADVQAGDWLLLVLITDNAHTVSAGLTGWAEEHDSTAAADHMELYSKLAGASESNVTIDFAAAEAGLAYIFRIRNAAGTTPFGQFTEQFTQTSTPAITPPANDHALIGLLHDDPGSTNTAAWTDATELVDDSRSGNAYSSLAYFIQETAASKALEFTLGTADSLAALIFDVEPAAAGGSTVEFSAAIAGQAAVTAANSITEAFAAAVGGQAAIAVNSTLTRVYEALISGQATVAAGLTRTRLLEAIVAGQATVVATMSIDGEEAAVVVRRHPRFESFILRPF